jgi:hypothetical protein
VPESEENSVRAIQPPLSDQRRAEVLRALETYFAEVDARRQFLVRANENEPEIASALRELSGWTVANGKLHRDYQFRACERTGDFGGEISMAVPGALVRP